MGGSGREGRREWMLEEVREDKGKRETERDKRCRGKGERDRKKRGTEGGRKGEVK